MTRIINFLGKAYLGPEAGIVQGKVDMVLSDMSAGELCSLYNVVASNIGAGRVSRFSDKPTALRRTWGILDRWETEPTEPTEPTAAPRKTRVKRFVFAPESSVKNPKDGSKRHRVLELLRRPEGATFSQVQEATGWSERQAYEGVRLIHYYSGYGLRETQRDGVTYIHAYTRQ